MKHKTYGRHSLEITAVYVTMMRLTNKIEMRCSKVKNSFMTLATFVSVCGMTLIFTCETAEAGL